MGAGAKPAPGGKGEKMAKTPYIMKKGVSRVNDLVGGRAVLGMGIGNVYYVVKSAEAFYAQFVEDHQGEYTDGSEIVHTTIQSALDATVECRNDYVIVSPSNSDYDLTAALTMSKKSVHLICPGGLGYDMGASNAARIEQTTDSTAIIAVSDAAVEIAGFYLKPYYGQSHITLAATSYAPLIHHNTFVLKWETGGANKPAIAGTGDACAWGGIERNWFVSQSGDDQTCPVVVDIKASATAARFNYNEMTLGDGNTATIGISNAATKGTVNYNLFNNAGSDATWTHCISIGSYGSAIGNRGTVADSILVTGGAAGVSLSDNMNGASGGAIDEA